MESSRVLTIGGCLVGILSVMPIALAQTPAKPVAPAKGEAVVASEKRTATVTKIDQKTREVTLKGEDGQEYSFVAGDAVKNLAQVKTGDLVTATYMEALAYEVKKGGKAAGAATTVAAGTAQPGATPAAAVAQQTTVTVTITAIDPKVPSVTFKGPAGNTRTIKVMRPEKLQGVSVGDTVDISYTEAFAIEVVKAPKK
jgi:hypothetical protein